MRADRQGLEAGRLSARIPWAQTELETMEGLVHKDAEGAPEVVLHMLDVDAAGGIGRPAADPPSDGERQPIGELDAVRRERGEP